MKSSLLFYCATVLTTATAAPSSKLLWSYYDPTWTFNSASVSFGPSSNPTFAVGTTLYTSIANSSTPGNAFAYQFDSSIVPDCNSNTCTAYVDQARSTTSSTDTFLLIVGNNNCNIFGYSSRTGKQMWSNQITNCSANEGTGASYRCWEASDDGNILALMGYGYDTGIQNQTVRAYIISGTDGKVKYTYDLKNKEAAGQGDIGVTPDGRYIAFVNEDSVPTPNSAQLHVLDSTTGKLRAEVQIPFFIAATVSDSGQYVCIQNFTHLVGSEVLLMKWDGQSYTVSSSIPAPSNFDTEYDVWDIQSSTLPSGREIVTVGWISAPSVLELRITIYDYATGTLLTEWAAPISKQYQNNPTIRTFGDYVGLALWGDNDNTPTTALLKVGSNSTLFTYVSPGSMFASDIVVDYSSPTNDVVYLVSAGKHEPANVFGGGGDAYAWQITVPK